MKFSILQCLVAVIFLSLSMAPKASLAQDKSTQKTKSFEKFPKKHQRLYKKFGSDMIPTAEFNGTTLGDIKKNTNCKILPKKLMINDPDALLAFEAQKSYCQLISNKLPVDPERILPLKEDLIEGQVRRMELIISLHSKGMYNQKTPNPTLKQWESLIKGDLKAKSFGDVEVEINKVIKARDELLRLGLKLNEILELIGFS